MTDLDLVPVASALPLSADEAREAMRTYQEISQALIDPATDIQVIETKKGPREFPKRSAFQKLANAYRVSTEILRRDLTHDDTGALVRCDAVVRATHPDGRYAEGDGACARSEERFARGADKIDHDLPATAVTRATNRAISNLVAFGAVSAEEASATDAPADAQPPGLPPWAEPFMEVGVFGDWLADVLTAAGVDEANARTSEVGEQILIECGGEVPRCVATTIAHLHRIVAVAGTERDMRPPSTQAATPAEQEPS